LGHPVRTSRGAETLVALQAARLPVNRQQPVGEVAIVGAVPILQGQFDPLPQQVRPTLLHGAELPIHRRIVADDQAGKRSGIQNLLEGLGILGDAEQQHPRLLRQQGPDALQTPTGLVGMHHQRIRQQRTKRLELPLPMTP
jgi:hypothetical protein